MAIHDLGFRISALRLRGYRKDYTVRFSSENGEVRPLSIIAGQISTGKTSVLEFIDFCLGASRYPEHIEVLEGVRSAQLQITAFEPVQAPSPSDFKSDKQAGDTLTAVSSDAVRWNVEQVQYVIERSIEGPSRSALLYKGTLESFEGVPRLLSADSSSEDSISKFLLQLCDLDGIRLRQAPRKADSVTHALSFRDLGPLWYLTNTRMDNKNLALEHHPHIAIKLRQVADLIFDVYDEVGAALADQINQLRSELSSERAGINALWAFLREQGVAGPLELEGKVAEVSQDLRRAQNELGSLDDLAAERTSFVAELRDDYLQKSREARESGARLRDRETLLRRLSPLRAQYAEDLKKLTLLVEAKRIFDPLSVTVCPACANDLLAPATIIHGQCSLCLNDLADADGPAVLLEALPEENSQLPISIDVEANGSHGHPSDSVDIDVSKERRSIQRRLNELKRYIESVEDEANHARQISKAADAAALSLQRQLDSMTHDAVTPLLGQRDRISRSISAIEARRSEMDQQRRMLESVEKKTKVVDQLAGRLSEAQRRLRDMEEERRGRDDVLSALSIRFEAILSAFSFPKLSGAEIDRQLIPHVRDLRYDRVGSSGALTLLALAWELSLFELAYEEEGRHPGFLLIDSPQKNLAPESRREDESEFSASTAGAIVNNVYSHITEWLSSAGRGAQIVIVDNVPPASLDDQVIVRFTGDPSRPPYGLIDDAVGG